ncbi:MAG: hypothetical protein PVJ57_04620 [Phycisphaerae bacterium]|jgi:hypothetical protein
MRYWTGLTLLLGLLSGATVRAQPVTGTVTEIGFRAANTNMASAVARSGQWIPIQVQLQVQGSQPFEGVLQFEAPDIDGDLVSYEAPVTVNPEANRRAWCYAIWLSDAFSSGAMPMLDVVSSDGLLINRLTVPQVELIRDDTMLILDVSANRLTQLRGQLETPAWDPGYPGYGKRPYYRDIVVAAMPATDLPDRWFGLEAIDVIIWDRPDPQRVSIPQIKALRRWIEDGGRLIVGLGDSWPNLAGSELADLLPVQPIAAGGGQRTTREVRQLDGFFGHFVQDIYQRETPARSRTFKEDVSIAMVEARPGALRAVRTLMAEGDVTDLLTAHWLGSGRVVAVAASLGDLLSVPVNESFYARLFDLNPTTDNFRKSESESIQFTLGTGARELYGSIVSPTSKTGWSSVLVLAAFAFVVAYVGVATLATWFWLDRYKLRQLSWTVFAVFAIVASLLSLGTVGVLRGVSRGVDMFSFIDLEAGASQARARCYFGYSSPSRLPLDLALTTESGFLRPLTRGPGNSSEYATPARYSAQPAQRRLVDAPRRATLKQFEGSWTGELTGNVRAQLVADRRTGQITAGSWLQNDLYIDFTGGYLLYLDPRLRDPEYNAAGQTANYWGRKVPPGMNVLALRVPPLRAGAKLQSIGAEQYAWTQNEQQRWQGRGGGKPEDMPDLPTLWQEQQGWAGVPIRAFTKSRHGLDHVATAALLASTRNFYLHCQEDFDKASSAPLNIEGLMGCDVSSWLAEGRVKAIDSRQDDALVGQAVLLLMADDPGPARLLGGKNELGPVHGRSLYRLRVPLALEGAPPRGLEP